jgi:hypothetical protein
MTVQNGQCIIYGDEKKQSNVSIQMAAFLVAIAITFGVSTGLAYGLGSKAIANEAATECDCQCEERGDTPAPTMKESVTTVTLNPAPIIEYKDDIEKMICKYQDWDCEVMYAIAKAESGGRCDAINLNANGSTDKGVLQINSIHGFSGDLFNCEYNIKKAHEVWLNQSYQAWTVFNTGKYLEFIK